MNTHFVIKRASRLVTKASPFPSLSAQLTRSTTMLPEVYFKQITHFNKRVLDRCRLLEQEYTKPSFLLNSHFETIWASIFRENLSLPLDRNSLNTPDGSIITLDTLKTSATIAMNAPIMLLIAGLAGGSSCSYVQYAIQSAYEAGMRPIVFNCRGTAESPLLTPQLYSASYTEDLRLVVAHLDQLYPQAVFCAMGWSLGANILVNYLAEEGSNTKIKAAASLCNPFDLQLCDQSLKIGFNSVYDWHLARGMQRCFKPHMGLFTEYDVAAAMSANSIRGVDNVITRVTFGWKSVDDYYRASGSGQRIHQVKISLLCIQAQDDPVAVSRAIPMDGIHENENCTLVITPYGGHLGWVTHEDGLFGPPWTNQVTFEWFKAFLAEINTEEIVLTNSYHQ